MTEVTVLLSAGQGPKECEWVVAQLAKTIRRDAEKAGLVCRPLFNGADGGSELFASLYLIVEGERADAFTVPYIGSIRWIGKSPFRPGHKRTNWFIGVSRLPDIKAVPELDLKDVQFQAMKAGGPGGQHVNTTDSAVRAVHGPTGLSVVAREERSQHANRKLALKKLAALLAGKKADAVSDARSATWLQHHALERGNAVRTYEGPKFRLKADAR